MLSDSSSSDGASDEDGEDYVPSSTEESDEDRYEFDSGSAESESVDSDEETTLVRRGSKCWKEEVSWQGKGKNSIFLSLSLSIPLSLSLPATLSKTKLFFFFYVAEVYNKKDKEVVS